MRLFCYNTDRSGCYWYRLLTPYKKIQENCTDFQFEFKIKRLEDVLGFDMVVLQRATDALAVEIMEYAHDNGIPVLYEVDDSLFNIDKVNPAHMYYSKADTRLYLDVLMHGSDYMTVSTEPLKEYYKSYFGHPDNIEVLPNSISLSNRPKRVHVDNMFRSSFSILVTGGVSHAGDWKFLTEVLREVVFEFSGRASVTVFGYVPESFKTIPNTRIVSAVTVDKYYEILASLDFDILLAPLEQIDFNTYKSNLKFVEAGSLSRPIIGSDVTAYNKDIEHGKNGWVLPNNPYQWAKHIKRLVRCRDEVHKVGKGAYDTVSKGYDLDKTWRKWFSFYNHILLNWNKPLLELKEVE